MKKNLLTILLCSILIMGIVGCSPKPTPDKEEKTNNQERYKCLENELGGYITTETSQWTEIPLKEITNKKDKIEYYKGIMANDENKYIILEMKEPSEIEVITDFELYFSKQYPTYQKAIIDNTYILIHTKSNDVNFKQIQNKCHPNDKQEDGKSLPSETIDKLNNTSEIIVYSGTDKLGTINKKETINNILAVATSIKQYGEVFLCDGNTFNLDLYNDQKELIDTIYLWADGRLIPKSIHNGCSYYSSTKEDINLIEIIEQETNYKLYEIFDYSDSCTNELERIYEDEKYNYYLNCRTSDKVLIYFDVTNLTMTLKYALNHNYITPSQLQRYDDLLVKKEK